MSTTSTTSDGTYRDARAGTLERGLAILQHFAAVGDSTPSAVASALGLSRSATYRLVERLREWGYLEADPTTERLRLGMQAAQLGMAALAAVDVVRLAPPYLHRLASETKETVNLALPDGDEMVYVYQEEGPASVKMTARLGTRRPLNCTGLGKAYLAALPVDARRARLGSLRLERLTPRSITEPAVLEDELRAVAERGYAVDNVEVEEGVACFAAAVRDARGRPVAAVSVAGPADRVLAKQELVTPLLIATTTAISHRLGHTR